MNKAISRSLAGLSGIALAAGAVYLFDPKKGQSRRAQISEQCKSAARRISDGTHDLGDEISERYHGASTRVSSWFDSRSRADRGLARRVRIDLWRAMSKLPDIGVIAHDGTVILHGEVLSQHHKQVLQVVAAVEGVVGIADHLTEPGGEKKNGAARHRIQQGYTRVRDSLMQDHWSPTTRVCSGTLGLALLRWGALHRNMVGGIGALTGAVLLVRSSTNIPLQRMVRRGKHMAEDVPGVAPAAEAIKRAGDELSHSSEWRKSTAAVS